MAGITACSSTVLSGRKKRESTLTEEKLPIAYLNGEMIDLRDLIKVSRVSAKSQSDLIVKIFE